MQILIGTNNYGKATEISESLSGLELDFITPKDLGIESDPEETGADFKENAILKAKHFNSLSSLPTIADDSGIIVDALQDELGLHTRRWGAGPEASDEEWIEYFLDRMKSEPNKKASFICTLAYVDHNNDLHLFEGECHGMITESLEADYLPGLPISACFRPEGLTQVFSSLTLDQKNSTSHRGRASQKLRLHLENIN
ncbi:non-canonical purine NTP pyrophosphatase [Patescibacteria group bacterium]|nr:non-canonical purine NTP pyrophosphatase [Patescibacteria group bacterium]MBU1123114.1 non-canonical purine NTP pyrophosphatase [Patescibacteria group bacterium]MBU1911104.1 non-canonical purine NTP pyrophosphatase [Patescibacteria group bacterium]